MGNRVTVAQLLPRLDIIKQKLARNVATASNNKLASVSCRGNFRLVFVYTFLCVYLEKDIAILTNLLHTIPVIGKYNQRQTQERIVFRVCRE